MVVQGLKTVSTSRVSLHRPLFLDTLYCSLQLLAAQDSNRGDNVIERPGRLHPTMQTSRLPLLRLGRLVARDEIVPDVALARDLHAQVPGHRVPHLPATQ